MKIKTQTILFWAVVGLSLIFLFNLWSMPTRALEEQIIFSDFMAKLDQGDIEKVIIKGHHISGVLKDNSQLRTYSADYPDLVQVLRERCSDRSQTLRSKPLVYPLSHDLGAICSLYSACWLFFMRRMQVGNQALSLVKSKARMLTDDRKKVTFSDVAGIDEVKEEVQETVEFLKDPRKFQKLGARIPKGVLVVGPPGTGKTLLAKAIAGEAGVPFFSISGSDFVEMFVGVGASRVRDMFEQAKKHAPCIMFIDEIDAVGRSRGAGLGGGNDEREQTLNQLLVEMDGFDTTEGVILVAATNRPDVLDPALLRPGRFDRQVVVNHPDLRGRSEILKVHTKNVPVAADVELERIARGTPGFSGPTWQTWSMRRRSGRPVGTKANVGAVDFEMAKDKIVMGAERRSMMLTDEEKRVTAYHEAGHALMAKLLPNTDPVHKVSIIPRGRALGVTMQLPTDDHHNYSKEFLYNTLAILMGGRVAEELMFKHVTTGAGNDLERATALARKMVCEWGMSEKLGPLTFGQKEGSMFLGRSIGSKRDVSDGMALEIDLEIRRFVTENYERTKRILTEADGDLESVGGSTVGKRGTGCNGNRPNYSTVFSGCFCITVGYMWAPTPGIRAGVIGVPATGGANVEA